MHDHRETLPSGTSRCPISGGLVFAPSPVANTLEEQRQQIEALSAQVAALMALLNPPPA